MDEKKELKEIDFRKIVNKLWQYRRRYTIVLPSVLVLTYLITCLVPRYYRCQVCIAPEPDGMALSGSLGSLLSTVGMSSFSKLGGNNDAINVDLYPSIVGSPDFIVKLMPVHVRTKSGDYDGDYYTYMRTRQKDSPWNKVRGWVAELIDPTPADSDDRPEQIDIFNITKLQSKIFKKVSKKVDCTLDRKTDMAIITVEDQDPLVCAMIAKAASEKLQEFIIDYRTKKASIDYEYFSKLTAQIKAQYDSLRLEYGNSIDANGNVKIKSLSLKIDDIGNEMGMKYNQYTALSTQMQASLAKLQEATPAFTLLQTASVPVKPAGPKRLIISVCMMLLSLIVMSVYIINRKA